MKQLVYFVMVGFSFVALQVATVEAQDNTEGCTAIERLDLKAEGRYEEHMSLWKKRCPEGKSQEACKHNRWAD